MPSPIRAQSQSRAAERRDLELDLLPAIGKLLAKLFR